MRLSSFLPLLPVAAASASTLSSRQTVGAPACLVLCSTQIVTSASGNCSPLDTTCYCQDPTASSALLTCVEDSCSADEIVSAWNLAIQACGGDINDDTAASASAVLESAAAAATSQVPISAGDLSATSESPQASSGSSVIEPSPTGSGSASATSTMSSNTNSASASASNSASAAPPSSSSVSESSGASQPSESTEPSGAAYHLTDIPSWLMGVGALAGAWLL